MQSEGTSPQSITQSSTQNQTLASKAASANPQIASAIPEPLRGMKIVPGGSPMDFIKANTPQKTAAPQLDPQKMMDDASTPEAATDEQLDLTPDVTAEPKKEEPKVEPKVDVKPESLAADADDLPDNAAPAAENFKRLRTKLREVSKTSQERAAELEATRKKLQEHETGMIAPEVLQKKDEEIQKLSKYKALVDLKVSDEYQEQIVAPLNEIDTKLKELATDYGVDDGALSDIMQATNKAELNRAISNHFTDDVGAFEVKQLVSKMRDIQNKSKQMEAQPIHALEQLIAENSRAKEAHEVQRKHSVAVSSRESWIESLLDIRKEGLAIELIPKESDPEHNEKFVKPIVTAAATEYSKIVNMLTDLGVKNMPKELAKALSKAVLYGHASALAIKSRDAALKHANEIETNTRRNTRYDRPSIGSSVSRSAEAAPKQAAPTAEQAAGNLINSVLSKRRA